MCKYIEVVPLLCEFCVNSCETLQGCRKTISEWLNSAKWAVVVFCFLLVTSQVMS